MKKEEAAGSAASAWQKIEAEVEALGLPGPGGVYSTLLDDLHIDKFASVRSRLELGADREEGLRLPTLSGSRGRSLSIPPGPIWQIMARATADAMNHSCAPGSGLLTVVPRLVYGILLQDTGLVSREGLLHETVLVLAPLPEQGAVKASVAHVAPSHGITGPYLFATRVKAEEFLRAHGAKLERRWELLSARPDALQEWMPWMNDENAEHVRGANADR